MYRTRYNLLVVVVRIKFVILQEGQSATDALIDVEKQQDFVRIYVNCFINRLEYPYLCTAVPHDLSLARLALSQGLLLQ